MRDYNEKAPSPKNGKRGCLCADGTYSRKCCDGSFEAQGIGSITLGQTDSAGNITQVDSTNTVSSDSTALPSQGSSTVTSLDTTGVVSTTTNDDYYDISQGTSNIVNIDTTNTVISVGGQTVVPATIDSIAISTGTYAVGDTLPLVVTYTDTVTVDTTGGTPSIDVDLNTNTRTFNYASGSTTSQLTFNYSLQAADTDITSATASSTIDLNGGTITDSNGLSTSSTVSTTSISLSSIDLPSSSSGTPSSIEEIVDGNSLVSFTTGYRETTYISSQIFFSGSSSPTYKIFDIQNLTDITNAVGEVMYQFSRYSPVYIMSDTIQVGAEVRPDNRTLDNPDSVFVGIDWTIPKYWPIYTSSEYLNYGYDNGTNTVVYVKRIIKVQENVNGKLIITAIYENEDAEGDQWVIT